MGPEDQKIVCIVEDVHACYEEAFLCVFLW
jgi:hypothetical protein